MITKDKGRCKKNKVALHVVWRAWLTSRSESFQLNFGDYKYSFDNLVSITYNVTNDNNY